MALGLQSDLMEFSPKQRVFTDKHIHFEYVFNMFSTTRVFCSLNWIWWAKTCICIGYLPVACKNKHAAPPLLSGSCSNDSYEQVLSNDSFPPTLTATHPYDIPPSLSFLSCPSLKGWKRGHSMESETLHVCEAFRSSKFCLPWLLRLKSFSLTKSCDCSQVSDLGLAICLDSLA